MKDKLSIHFLWSIGKKTYINKNKYGNIIEKYSIYYSYHYGNSYLFTRENIRKMQIFYLDFPIFFPQLEYFSWEQYKLLFNVVDKKERLFYFYILLFFRSNYDDTCELIKNDYYQRI